MKEEPGSSIELKHRLFGIRAEESSRRKALKQLEYNKVQKIWQYKPIFHWLEWEIWQHIESYRLPSLSLYQEGFARIGCVICPFHAGNHDIYRKRWPKHFVAFEKAMKKLYLRGKADGNKWNEKNFDEFLSVWYAGK